MMYLICFLFLIFSNVRAEENETENDKKEKSKKSAAETMEKCCQKLEYVTDYYSKAYISCIEEDDTDPSEHLCAKENFNRIYIDNYRVNKEDCKRKDFLENKMYANFANASLTGINRCCHEYREDFNNCINNCTQYNDTEINEYPNISTFCEKKKEEMQKYLAMFTNQLSRLEKLSAEEKKDEGEITSTKYCCQSLKNESDFVQKYKECFFQFHSDDDPQTCLLKNFRTEYEKNPDFQINKEDCMTGKKEEKITAASTKALLTGLRQCCQEDKQLNKAEFLKCFGNCTTFEENSINEFGGIKNFCQTMEEALNKDSLKKEIR